MMQSALHHRFRIIDIPKCCSKGVATVTITGATTLQ
jgi:hypothetical protein